MIITIDGPSGSGKSTLALGLAKQLNFFCLNSGYLYRGITYVLKAFYAYDESMLQDPNMKDVEDCLFSGKFQYAYVDGRAYIYWNGQDVTLHLKDPEISQLSAYLAQHAGVRAQIRKFERTFISGHNLIVEGRACGSVVFPQAELKFYLTAIPEIRAARLMRDQAVRGKILTMQQALDQILMRDRMDRERDVEPLTKPEGAIELDSSIDAQEALLKKAVEHVYDKIKHKKTD